MLYKYNISTYYFEDEVIHNEGIVVADSYSKATKKLMKEFEDTNRYSNVAEFSLKLISPDNSICIDSDTCGNEDKEAFEKLIKYIEENSIW